MTYGYLRSIAVLMAVLLTPNLAIGQSDTTPPILASFSITPDSIDTTAGTQPVTVTMQVRDDLAGFSGAVAEFRSPSGTQSLHMSLQLASGTPLDGLAQGRFATADGNFPQFTESGSWTVFRLVVRDSASNAVVHTTDTLQALGFPATLDVTSVPDTTPPQVVGLRLTPSAIDVSAGGRNVIVELDLSDVLSGVLFFDFNVRSPSGGQLRSRQFPAGLQDQPFAEFQLISGDRRNGTWRATLNIPQFSEAGTWTIDVLLSDSASNRVSVSPSQLQTLGLPSELMVASVPSDTTGPQLADLSFSPTLIDTSTSAQQVQVTYAITDNPAGVDFGPEDGLFGISVISVRSPSGAQSVSAIPADLIEGTPQNGRWRQVLTFPRFSEAGTWSVSRVRLKDVVRNITLYDTAGLIAAGLPSDLIVVRPSLEVDGTVGPSGSTVMDQTFGARAQVTFPPGALSATTDVAIDVFGSSLPLPIPSGFSGPGTRFVNIDLTPEPTFPLPLPGLTVVLPLTNAMVAGSPIDLFKADPATGDLVPARDVLGQPVAGTVDASGLSATFTGVSGLSIVVGLVPLTQPFEKLTAHVRVDQRGHGFEMQGEFKLGANSDGIDPTVEQVSVQVGPYATDIPSGLFSANRRKTRFEFHGTIHDVKLEVRIRALSGRKFEYAIESERVNLTGITNPVTVNLVIGDDGGNVDVNAKVKRH